MKGAAVCFLWLIWLPAMANPYTHTIAVASERYGLPHGMLERLLHVESNFRDDVVSHRGAVGIAQIRPEHHPGVDPTKPQEAITYAAKYLRRLHDRFGSWCLALAAYNWGPTHVARNDYLPVNVRAYVRRILPKEC